MGKEKLILILIVVLGLVLRLVGIGQSFWLDEASQAQMSSLTIEQIWYGRAGDFHPPLFYILSHFWQEFGRTEIYLRLLPVLFGVLSILAIYHLAKKLPPQFTKAGLIAALLLSINPYHVYYSQEYRMYSLVVLLAIVSWHLLVKKNRWWFLTSACLLYTHYSSSFLLLSQVVYIVIFDRPKLRYLLSQLVLTALLYLPWWPQFQRQLSAGVNIDEYLPGWREVLTLPLLKSPFVIFFKLVAGRIDLYPRIVYGLYISFVFGVVGLGLILAKKARTLLWSWTFIPVLASIVLSTSIPQTQPFRLIFVLPGLLLLLTQAIGKFPKTFLTLIIYVSVVGNLMQMTRPRLARENWREAIGFLETIKAPVVVKFSDAFSPMYWYAPNLPVIAPVKEFPAQAHSVQKKLLEYPLPDRLMVLDYLKELTDPNNQVDQVLKELGYVRILTKDFTGVGFIHEYQRP